MNNLSFKHTPEEKLKWIASFYGNIDPRLSQIYPYCPLPVDNLYEDFYLEPDQILLFPDMAEVCLESLDLIDQKDKYAPDHDKEYYYDIADAMYACIVQYNMWGITYSG